MWKVEPNLNDLFFARRPIEDRRLSRHKNPRLLRGKHSWQRRNNFVAIRTRQGCRIWTINYIFICHGHNSLCKSLGFSLFFSRGRPLKEIFSSSRLATCTNRRAKMLHLWASSSLLCILPFIALPDLPFPSQCFQLPRLQASSHFPKIYFNNLSYFDNNGQDFKIFDLILENVEETETENFSLSKPKISLLPSAVIAFTLFVFHFVCIYWLKFWMVPDFRIANKIEQVKRYFQSTSSINSE